MRTQSPHKIAKTLGLCSLGGDPLILVSISFPLDSISFPVLLLSPLCAFFLLPLWMCSVQRKRYYVFLSAHARLQCVALSSSKACCNHSVVFLCCWPQWRLWVIDTSVWPRTLSAVMLIRAPPTAQSLGSMAWLFSLTIRVTWHLPRFLSLWCLGSATERDSRCVRPSVVIGYLNLFLVRVWLSPGHTPLIPLTGISTRP